MIKTLSLDLSTVSTGWAYFEEDKLITSGTIIAKEKDPIKRIKTIFEGLYCLFLNYSPDQVVSEAPVYVQYKKRDKRKNEPRFPFSDFEKIPEYQGNPKVFIKLCKLHGVLLSICFKYKVDLQEIDNLRWKSHYFNGNLTQVTKKQSFEYVKKILYSKVDSFDSADSILLGKAFLSEQRFKSTIVKNEANIPLEHKQTKKLNQTTSKKKTSLKPRKRPQKLSGWKKIEQALKEKRKE